jgi:hypothetical protein
MSDEPLSLAELLRLLPRIQATLELLVGEGHAPAIGSAKRGRRGRNSSDVPAKLLAALKQSKKGLSLGQLQQKVRADRGAIKYHLRSLRSKKKTRVEGSRKQARWLAV